jgi:hypothetical protein
VGGGRWLAKLWVEDGIAEASVVMAARSFGPCLPATVREGVHLATTRKGGRVVACDAKGGGRRQHGRPGGGWFYEDVGGGRRGRASVEAIVRGGCGPEVPTATEREGVRAMKGFVR